jgi:DNA invertase Pin-like site-specific DNA recombinase
VANYGYARASAQDQSTAIQEEALKAAGCDVIRTEKRSGTSTQGRDQLRTILRLHPRWRRADGHAHR